MVPLACWSVWCSGFVLFFLWAFLGLRIHVVPFVSFVSFCFLVVAFLLLVILLLLVVIGGGGGVIVGVAVVVVVVIVVLLLCVRKIGRAHV